MIRNLSFLVLAGMCVAGCGSESGAGKKTESGSVCKVEVTAAQSDLEKDFQRLCAFSTQLNELAGEMEELRKSVKLKERGYYTSDEHDSIESILFRYLVCRDSLWQIIDKYRDYHDLYESGADRTKAFVTGFSAAIHLEYYSSLVVYTFMDDDAVKAKLNEKFYRVNIAPGTYDALFKSVTSIEHIEALKTAWHLYSGEIADRDTELYRLSVSDTPYAEMIRKIGVFAPVANDRIEEILDKKSLLLPDVRNRIRHTAIMDLAREAKRKIDDNLYAARGILFVNVSRLKSPLSSNIRFTEEQVVKMKSMLKPGDVIMTFSAGYMSNIFLPGNFKHGLTYIGSPRERRALGVPDRKIADVPVEMIDMAEKAVATERLENGKEADLIEAVAEGVIFNSLSAIADEHIARLCVLRPRINSDEIRRNLTTVFLQLGNVYDFKFDFSDASCLCCTEVIYRALNKVGPVDFKLTPRMGVQTLAADDIINYYLSDEAGAFDLVLYAEEDLSQKDGKAVILTGTQGHERLAALMKN